MKYELHSISKEELSKVAGNEGKTSFQKRHYTWYARSDNWVGGLSKQNKTVFRGHVINSEILRLSDNHAYHKTPE